MDSWDIFRASNKRYLFFALSDRYTDTFLQKTNESVFVSIARQHRKQTPLQKR